MANITIPAFSEVKEGEKPTMGAMIPQEYHDRGYLKDFLGKEINEESLGLFVKKLDESQKLIGKKTGIPDEKADDKAWEEFHAKLRPEKEDAYEILTAEGKEADENLSKVLRKAFHTAGLTSRQAKAFQKPLLEFFASQHQEMAKKQEEMDAAFDKLVKDGLGENGSKALERTKNVLNEFTPEALKPHLSKLTDENLVIMAGVVDSLLQKYASEDDLAGKGDGTGTGGGKDEAESLTEELYKTLASAEWTNQFSPKHDSAKQKVRELSERIAKINAQGKKK